MTQEKLGIAPKSRVLKVPAMTLDGPKKMIYVKLEGTIVRHATVPGQSQLGRPIRGAKKFLEDLAAINLEVIIVYHSHYSAGTGRGTEEVIESWLKQHELPFDRVHVGMNRPVAYVGDQAVTCTPQKKDQGGGFWDDSKEFEYAVMEIERLVGIRP